MIDDFDELLKFNKMMNINKKTITIIVPNSFVCFIFNMIMVITLNDQIRNIDTSF